MKENSSRFVTQGRLRKFQQRAATSSDAHKKRCLLETSLKKSGTDFYQLLYIDLIASQIILNPKERIQNPKIEPIITRTALVIFSFLSILVSILPLFRILEI